MRTCHICKTEIPDFPEPCAVCVEAFPKKPAGNVMAAADRVAELTLLFDGPTQVPFPLIHARIESLVGRPVWTHEIGLNWRELIEECRTQPGLDTEKVVGDLVKWCEANDKPLIVISDL